MPRSAFFVVVPGWVGLFAQPTRSVVCIRICGRCAGGGGAVLGQTGQAGAARRLLGTILESRRTFRPSRAPSDTERPKQCPETSEPPRRATRQPDQIGDPPIDGVATVDEDRSATNAVRPASGAARGRRARPVKAAGAATAPSAQQRAGATKRLDGPETSAPSPQWIRPAARRGMVAAWRPTARAPTSPDLAQLSRHPALSRRHFGISAHNRDLQGAFRHRETKTVPRNAPGAPPETRRSPAGGWTRTFRAIRGAIVH